MIALRKLLGSIAVLVSAALAAAASAAPVVDVEADIQGSHALSKHCGACHGQDLLGQDGYPSLLAASGVMQPQQIVRVLLNGKFDRGGEVAGHTVAVMPQLDTLADYQIASIVNALYRLRSEQSDKSLRPVRTITAEDVRVERMLGSDERSSDELSPQQYESAAKLYFEHCAACHGVRRQGGGGGPLYSWVMDALGSRYLQTKLHFGSVIGMPGWGDSRVLDEEEVDLMARFLQEPAPAAPVFDAADVAASWREQIPLSARPKRRQFKIKPENLFVSLLHDTGQIALIDGPGKKVHSIVDVRLAPHEVEVSANGRYLYVMSRGAEISLIDLYLKQPAVVASVRVGIEGRSLAAGRSKRTGKLVAAAYWPPQFTILEPQTLKPLLTQLLDSSAYEQGYSAREVSQVIELPRTNDFALLTKVEGTIELLSLTRKGDLRRDPESLVAEPLLRAGGFDVSNRYLLVPADQEKVVVFDTQQREVIAVVDAPGLQGGSRGAAYVDPEFGPVWAVGSMLGDSVAVIGTDPVDHGDAAWRVVRKYELPGGGSLHAVTHPASSNLWLDVPLNANPSVSQNAYVFDLKRPGSEVKPLPISHWADLKDQKVRILHPQFDQSGEEVWFTVWNDSDKRSAIVVVNDKSLKLIRVIHDERLLTPIRTFSVASLLRSKRR